MNDHGLNIDLKRFSQTSANEDSELGLYRNDQHREKPDWETYGLQVAKLEKLEGWRLWVTITCLLIGLFMSGLESSIIATALVPISAAFHGGERANWIVASYFISYTGFLIIFARLSDLFGRKPMHLIAITIFTIFSAACGGAQTMTQLIVLRSFQGMGAAGLYSLAMFIVPEVTPEKHISYAIGSFAPTFALSSLLGPLLGGIITTYTNWRWIFFLKSAFIAGFPFMMTTIFLPQRFQLQNGLSAKDAGYRMLPLLLVSAASGAIFAVIAKRFNIAWCILLGSLCLQIVAFGLFTTLPTTGELSDVQYGCQVLLGLGFGGTLSSFLILVRSEVSENEYGQSFSLHYVSDRRDFMVTDMFPSGFYSRRYNDWRYHPDPYFGWTFGHRYRSGCDSHAYHQKAVGGTGFQNSGIGTENAQCHIRSSP
ncbi:uncharacterized protein PG998_004200 [Apiospora kogelbergensis]|uniref:uncharacterized protein n=1 Tax=Apiospora kogelbergensis TaxID=1337665 RepID=UPI00313220DF